jgi:hypothetical protein
MTDQKMMNIDILNRNMEADGSEEDVIKKWPSSERERWAGYCHSRCQQRP